MITFINKIRKSIAINGIVGTIRLSLDFALRYILWFTPSRRREREISHNRDLGFDQEWGVDTSGTSVPDKLEVVGSNWKYGNKYQGCDPAVFSEVLENLAIQYQDFTFVDLGSGKGRALLLASRFPFRQIIGVEFSEELCQIAQQNVFCFPKSEMQCKGIATICDDAARYKLPEGSLVIFLYNPFGKQVMERVVQNVMTSYQQDPRRILVVYMTAYFADLWKNAGFLREVRSDWIAIYDTQSS